MLRLVQIYTVTGKKTAANSSKRKAGRNLRFKGHSTSSWSSQVNTEDKFPIEENQNLRYGLQAP